MFTALLLAATLTQRIDGFLAAPTLRGAHVGILAANARDGRVVYAHAADDDVVPASTFKLVVGSAALALLGPDATLQTRVSLDGTTLYLHGGGDAHLSIADLDDAARTVAASGFTRGSLVGDATRYDAPRYPPGWSIDDVPYGYAAVPSALSIDENVAHVRIRPGSTIGAPAQLQLQTPSSVITFANETVTGPCGSTDTTDVSRLWNAPTTIVVTGSYPICAPLSDDLEPALPDPPAYALDLFAQALARAGVTVTTQSLGATPPSARTIWTHDSTPLASLLAEFWLPSDNLVAELLLQELGARAPHTIGVGDVRARGIATERAWLRSIGVDPATLTIADGSGLSEYDRVTPRALVAILEADWHSRERGIVRAALPLSGERGTLVHDFTGPDLRDAVNAKTGTLNHARLLAGYLRTRGGTLAFALMIDNWMDVSPHARRALNAVRREILDALAGIDPSTTHPLAPGGRS